MRFILVLLLFFVYLDAKTPYEMGKELYMKKADSQAQKMMITYSVDLSEEENEERYDDSFETYGDGGS